MTQKVDIVKATGTDISAIALIEKMCIPDGWSEKSFFDWIKNNNTVIFKAVTDGEIIGFANGSWVLDEGELLNIAVCKEYRKNGIADKLFKALESFFAENGVNTIFLEVREKNFPAINFYEKQGFMKNGLRKNYYRTPTDNGVLMMKNIGV